MNFSAIGNMNIYLNNLNMQAKWNMKKQNPSMEMGSRNPQVNDGLILQASQYQEQNQKNYSMEQISSKMQSGQALSPAELEYLRQENPELYQKAMSMAAERRAYEQALKNCKTKEEVTSLRMQQTQALIPQMKAAVLRKDLAYCKEIDMRANGMTATFVAFVNSPHYAGLAKTEAERLEAEKDTSQMPATEEAAKEPKPAPDTEGAEATPPQNAEGGDAPAPTGPEAPSPAADPPKPKPPAQAGSSKPAATTPGKPAPSISTEAAAASPLRPGYSARV